MVGEMGCGVIWGKGTAATNLVCWQTGKKKLFAHDARARAQAKEHCCVTMLVRASLLPPLCVGEQHDKSPTGACI